MTPPSKLDGLRIARPETRRRTSLVSLVAIIVAVLLIAAIAWWFSRPKPIEVRTATARALSSSAPDRTVLNASGYVTARRAATVSSKVTGKVQEVLVEEGIKVAAGQVLARIDDTNVRANFMLAQAQASAARAAQAETRVRIAEAERDLKRQTDLHTRSVASQADFDRAEAAAQALRARLEQQQAETLVAERSVAIWEQQLDDTVIRAPFSGTVTSKNAQPGEMISPMSTGGFTRTGICTLVDMESLEIEIDVNESYINRVETGQAVEAVLDAYPDWRIPCHVIAVIPTADRNKSTVRVRVGFDKLDPRILPEMSAKVAFRPAAGAANVVVAGVQVPRGAVVVRSDRSVVFVMNGERVERRAVAVASVEGDFAVVKSGLEAGERVILTPPPHLENASAVKEIKP